MQKNYESYSAEQFLDDAFFIQWIKGESPAANDYWNEWINSNPPNLGEMKVAEKQLWAIILAKRIKAESADANEVWERIQNSLATKKPSKILEMPQRWWAAAAVLLLLASGSYFFLHHAHSKTELASIKKNTLINDIAPGGNKAILTLSNGKKIILDSLHNGVVTQQGNSKIVKLNNGKLEYQSEKSKMESAVQYNTVVTPRGGQYQLVLADGSKVWLNAASSIHFPTAFTGNERNVEITGEAYFEVAHNATMPFHVKVNNMDVEVLGTHFNINAYDDEGVMKTTLLEGSVKVSEGNESIFITPGEQAEVGNSSDNIEVKKDVDLDEVVAWKNGKFIFNNSDLKSIMRQLERWYNIDVVYKSKIPDEEFIGIISRNVNISEILKMLETTGAVQFEIDGRKIIVK